MKNKPAGACRRDKKIGKHYPFPRKMPCIILLVSNDFSGSSAHRTCLSHKTVGNLKFSFPLFFLAFSFRMNPDVSFSYRTKRMNRKVGCLAKNHTHCSSPFLNFVCHLSFFFPTESSMLDNSWVSRKTPAGKCAHTECTTRQLCLINP